MMEIEIFGSGCAKCKKTEKNVRKALEQLGLEASIVKIEDLQEIVARGVVVTPAIFVDGVARIVGYVPSVEEIVKVLR